MGPLLDNWVISYALLEDFDTEYPIERPCSVQILGDDPPEGCYLSARTNAITMPVMEAYSTLQIVVIIQIEPTAKLANREIGIKILSDFGSSEAGGDHDETAVWDDSCTLDANKDGLPDNFRPNCDTNEQIIELRLRAPDLKIVAIIVDKFTGEVGEMLSVNVEIVNAGNTHATDVNIILCVDQSPSDIKRNGCDEDNIVYRQIVQAIMPCDNPQTTPPCDGSEPPQIALLYMVEAGNHDVVVVVDPDNIIVETDESIDSNIKKVSKKMGSNLGILDVGIEIVAQYTVPTIILGATISLVGVVAVVMWSRREEAKIRYAEKSSMLSNLDDEDMVF
jgi:hypothetical protein